MRVFPGGTNCLQDGITAALDITGTAVSVSCWCRGTTLDANDRMMVAKGQNLSVRVQYKIHMSNARFGFQLGNGAGFDFVVTTLVPVQDRWYHVVGTYNGSRMDIYVNGQRNASTSTTRSIASGGWQFRVGLRDDNTAPFIGNILEVGVWNAGLVGDEVHKLWQGVSPLNIRPGNLRGYFPLDDYGSSGGSFDLGRFRANLSMVGAVGLQGTPLSFFDVALNRALKSTQETPHGVYGGGAFYMPRVE